MIKVFRITIRHFFPRFSFWCRDIEDPRNPVKIAYSLESLIWIAILLFVTKLGARRQIKFQFNTDAFSINMKRWLGLEKIPHGDTLNYVLKKIPTSTFRKLRLLMVRRLIRMKCFTSFRLLDLYYLVAIDGTGTLSFDKRHCKHCLRRTHKGQTTYYHYVLEAKLVFSNGMALSIGTEFIENENTEIKKQDCELKAFYRLAEQMKKDFPQLKMCLLLDGLYAGSPVFDICQRNDWKYLVTFKEGSMPAAYEEFESLKKLHPYNQGSFVLSRDIQQQYQWVCDLQHKGHNLNVLECRESKKDKTITFVWITNFNIHKNNFHTIANSGGRMRWKIENEGYNAQKNGGYGLEHPYSYDSVAAKNFYLLMQIAHIMNQLMEKGSLLKKNIKQKYGCLKNIAKALLEELKYRTIDFTQLPQLALKQRIQIRFDTS